MKRGDRCSVPGYGNGTLIGWDTDCDGIHGASRYVTVRFDDGGAVIVYRSDLLEPEPLDGQP